MQGQQKSGLNFAIGIFIQFKALGSAVVERQARFYVGDSDPFLFVDTGPEAAAGIPDAKAQPAFMVLSLDSEEGLAFGSGYPMQIGILNNRLQNHRRYFSIKYFGFDGDIVVDDCLEPHLLNREVKLNEFDLVRERYKLCVSPV